MSTTTEPEVSSKRERILRAAVEVFARNGYFNAKVSEVAKAAGVADGTIYLYFQNKEELLVMIFREQTRKYLELLHDELSGVVGAREKIRRAIRFHLEVVGRDRALAVVFQVELRHSLKFMSLFSHLEVAEYLNFLRTLVEEGEASGEFRKNIHSQLVAKSIFGILDEMVTSWILSEKDYRLDEHADAIADFVLEGVSAR
jgi:TetR/AcrR family fatty acid metabolism transcriptional regulator